MPECRVDLGGGGGGRLPGTFLAENCHRDHHSQRVWWCNWCDDSSKEQNHLVVLVVSSMQHFKIDSLAALVMIIDSNIFDQDMVIGGFATPYSHWKPPRNDQTFDRRGRHSQLFALATTVLTQTISREKVMMGIVVATNILRVNATTMMMQKLLTEMCSEEIRCRRIGGWWWRFGGGGHSVSSFGMDCWCDWQQPLLGIYANL